MTRQRKHFTAEQKAAIVRRHLVDAKPVADVFEENGLQPTVFYRWQKQVFDSLPALFERKNDKSGSGLRSLEEEVRRLRRIVARKDEIIAEATGELIDAKKTLGADNASLDCPRDPRRCRHVSREFHEFIRLSGMTHVRTSPYYPQSNGKIERFHGSLKRECVRPGTPVSPEDARHLVGDYGDYYNNVRLHSAIGYVTPAAALEGRAEAIQAERQLKLQAARLRRERETPLTGKEVAPYSP